MTRSVLAIVCGSLMMATGAFAAEAEAAPPSFDAVTTLWVLVAAFMVFFMQIGFGMVESGMIRAKNTTNVLMKNLVDFCFALFGFYLFGYALMYGSDGAIVGTSGWFMMGVETPVDGLPLPAFWLFQVVFAGTAATIASGAMAERMRFAAYLVYAFAICAFVYPVVGHWVWGGGWLSGLGFHDFAGSTVVHGVGGVTALVGAKMLGPRIGRFNPDGSPNFIGGHSMPLMALGVFILWFGWYGFNAGSSLGFDDPELVARVAMNTTLAAGAGATAAMLTAWKKFGKPDLALSVNGSLAGLVSITAPCAVVGSGASIVIGLVGGVLVVFGVIWLDKIRVDDVVGAFPVHGLCGIWGTLAVGLFGLEAFGGPADGLFYGGGLGQLGVQALGVAAVSLWAAALSFAILKAVGAWFGLRVSREDETEGLDVTTHGEHAYDL